MIIKLSQGKTTIIDDADYPLIEGYSWYAHKDHAKDVWRAYAKVRIASNKWENVLNNQRSNLRFATKAQNIANQQNRKPSALGYKGIKLLKRKGTLRKPWMAHLRAKGKCYYSCSFATAREAALAYNKLALEHHGEFAVLNEVSEV